MHNANDGVRGAGLRTADSGQAADPFAANLPGATGHDQVVQRAGRESFIRSSLPVFRFGFPKPCWKGKNRHSHLLSPSICRLCLLLFLVGRQTATAAVAINWGFQCSIASHPAIGNIQILAGQVGRLQLDLDLPLTWPSCPPACRHFACPAFAQQKDVNATRNLVASGVRDRFASYWCHQAGLNGTRRANSDQNRQVEKSERRLVSQAFL